MSTERGQEAQRLEFDHLSRVRDYYTEAQRFYRLAWHGNTNGLHYGIWTDGVRNLHEAILNENRVLADLARVQPGDVILDAGCGIGGSGVWLAEHRRAEVVGINIVPAQIEEATRIAKKRGLSDNLRFMLANYQDIPLPDDSVDVVWSLESIEHATDAPRFIEESYRVLKPGGRIVVAATFLGRGEVTQKEREQMELGQQVSGCFNDFRTADQIAEVMSNTGFSGVRNINATKQVMRSSRRMTIMCKAGLIPARVVGALGLVSRAMVLNEVWGTYQEGLFKSGATSYNLLYGLKTPSETERTTS